MRTIGAICVILVVSLSGFGQTRVRGRAQRGPAATATSFYQKYLRLKVSGLPDDKQLRQLSPYFTADLMRLFEAARQAQDKFARENPDEKPPWADGDLFTSLFEGAQTFRIGKPTTIGDRVEVPVHLSYSSEGATSRWTDVMVLVNTPAGWRIYDILMKGEWQFKNGESLRKILTPA